MTSSLLGVRPGRNVSSQKTTVDTHFDGVFQPHAEPRGQELDESRRRALATRYSVSLWSFYNRCDVDRIFASAQGRGAAPPGLTVDVMEVGGQELVVVSHPLDPTLQRVGIEALPAAMREVAALALEGLDNAAIARRRGTSVRTVAKQIEAIYRRLGVGSRRELMARFGAGPMGGA